MAQVVKYPKPYKNKQTYGGLMKKQLGVLVMVLAAAQLVFGAVKNVASIEIERAKMEKKLTTDRFAGKTAAQISAENGTHISALAKSAGLSVEHTSRILELKAELIDTLLYVDAVEKLGSEASQADKDNAENAKIILKNYGVSKLSPDEIAEAKQEAPAVQKMVELLPLLANWGGKAAEMGRVFAVEAKAGLKLNKALRSAARRVLGLEGDALETFMKDPRKGLGSCIK